MYLNRERYRNSVGMLCLCLHVLWYKLQVTEIFIALLYFEPSAADGPADIRNQQGCLPCSSKSHVMCHITDFTAVLTALLNRSLLIILGLFFQPLTQNAPVALVVTRMIIILRCHTVTNAMT